LCYRGVDLFREHNDLVLADGGFPILAFEDEGCRVALRYFYRDENIDLVVDSTYGYSFPRLDGERLLAKRWRRLQNHRLYRMNSTLQLVTFAHQEPSLNHTTRDPGVLHWTRSRRGGLPPMTWGQI